MRRFLRWMPWPDGVIDLAPVVPAAGAVLLQAEPPRLAIKCSRQQGVLGRTPAGTCRPSTRRGTPGAVADRFV